MKNYEPSSTSTALEIFKQSHSDVYNSTLSSYGQFDRMCLDLNTMIAVPGIEKYVSLGSLIDQYADGEKFIVYAYDHEIQQIVPAWAHHPRSSGIRKTVKITFDDGSNLICTHDHPCMMRDGSFVEAAKLNKNDSMMPFYRKDFSGGESGYYNIYTMEKHGWNGWTSEHRLIAEWKEERSVERKSEHVHHKDFNPSNNTPENLVIMNAHDHLSMHAKLATHMKSPKMREHLSRLQKEKWANDDGTRRKNLVSFNKRSDIIEKRRQHATENNQSKNPSVAKKISEKAIKRYSNPHWKEFASKQTSRLHKEGKLKVTKNFSNYWSGKTRPQAWKDARSGKANHAFVNIEKDDLIDAILRHTKRKDVAIEMGVSPSTVKRRASDLFDLNSWKEIVEHVHLSYQNHKVISVEPWVSLETGDITVDGYENFATDTIIVHNSRYGDFSEMESTPEIASALDIYAEECVSPSASGEVLHIHSDNRKIQEILEGLFHDTLNVDFNLVMWVRNLVKYGDFFLFNDISPEYGVINAFPIAISEIEREEGFDKDDPAAVRFRWITQGNQVLENWQVSHFRLLGNDAFLPYGSSVLESSRRIWRQLILIEDAMLVYRVIRAPERRVFYIDVGNVPPEDVGNYLEQAKTSLKRNQIVDKDTGKVDLRYNPLCIYGDNKVPLLDGRTIKIKDLVAEWNDDKRDQEVYSVNLKDGGTIVPGKIIWAGKTGEVEKLIEVELDDGGLYRVTPDHKLMLRDGNPIKAKDLKLGDSLMPLYRRYQDISPNKKNAKYEQVYVPKQDKFVYTHRVVAASKYDIALNDAFLRVKDHVVHHANFNKHDNSSDNLVLMERDEHSRLHAEIGRKHLVRYNKSDEKRKKQTKWNIERNSIEAMSWYNGSELHKSHNKARKEAQLKSWASNKEKRSKAMRYNFDDVCVQLLGDIARQLDKKVSFENFANLVRHDETFMSHYRHINEHIKRTPEKSIHRGNLRTKLKEKGFANYYAFLTAFNPKIMGHKFVNNIVHEKEKQYTNHKVTAIREIITKESVYNVTVEGNFNLGIASYNDIDNQKSSIITYQSVDEDYFLPVRGGESGTKIDTLAGGQNTAAIEDVEYIQKKLFAALKIPRAYLGYDEDVGCLTGDIMVDLLDGRQVSMSELVNEYEQGKNNWVYSFDLDGTPKPGKISNAWKTKDVTELYEIELDNGKKIKCTANHPFLLKRGVYVRADELKEDMPLMALYSRDSKKSLKDYEQIFDHNTRNWIYTHRMVNENTEIPIHDSAGKEDYDVVHHATFDKKNNSPDSLLLMGRKSHIKLHAEHGENLLSEVSRDRLREVMKSESYKINHIKGVQEAWDNDKGNRRAKLSTDNKKYDKIDLMTSRLRELINLGKLNPSECLKQPRPDFSVIVGSVKAGNHTLEMICNDIGFGPVVTAEIIKTECGSWNEFVDIHDTKASRKGRALRHYNIVKAKELAATCKTRKEFHNRNIVSRTAHENQLTKHGLSPTAWYSENIGAFNHKVASVKKLILTAPIPVFDIQVEGWSNFVVENSIVVHNSKATLAQEDIRFSRTIQRIQKTIVSELNKLAMIHLYAHGYEGEDLVDFVIKLSNPSSIAQQQKLELIRSKFEIAGTAPEGLVDRNWIRKNVLELTKQEIEFIEEGKVHDKLRDVELEATGAEESADTPAGDTPGGEEGGEDLFAGDTAQGSLLVATPGPNRSTKIDDKDDDDEDVDEIDLSSFSIEDLNAPTKIQNRIRNVFNEPIRNSRKNTSGPGSTHMPDFHKMTSIGRSGRRQDTLNKPFDDDFMKDPFGESIFPKSPTIDNFIDNKIKQSNKMTREMESVIQNLEGMFSVGKTSILNEDIDSSIADEDLGFEVTDDNESEE